MGVEELLVLPFAYPIYDLLEHAKGLHALQNQDLYNSAEHDIQEEFR